MKIKEDHKDHRINKMQKQENNILPEYQTLPPDSIAQEYPSLPDEVNNLWEKGYRNAVKAGSEKQCAYSVC